MRKKSKGANTVPQDPLEKLKFKESHYRKQGWFDDANDLRWAINEIERLRDENSKCKAEGKGFVPESEGTTSKACANTST